jgi:hypothetical protein
MPPCVVNTETQRQYTQSHVVSLVQRGVSAPSLRRDALCTRHWEPNASLGNGPVVRARDERIEIIRLPSQLQHLGSRVCGWALGLPSYIAGTRLCRRALR